MNIPQTAAPRPAAEEPSAAFAELGRILYGDQPLTPTLQRVAELAQHTIPELTDVSVTLIDDDRPRTVVFAGALAVHLDERQYAEGFGPCTDAAVSGNTILVDTRGPGGSYPDFAREAAARGITHVLSVGLPIPQRTVGALNMYSRAEGPFAEASIKLAETFAGFAAVAIANTVAYHDAVDLTAHLHVAMESRAVIEQAKGVILARERCTADEAFALLARMSQRSNTKLRDVAASLVDRAGRGV